MSDSSLLPKNPSDHFFCPARKPSTFPSVELSITAGFDLERNQAGLKRCWWWMKMTWDWGLKRFSKASFVVIVTSYSAFYITKWSWSILYTSHFVWKFIDKTVSSSLRLCWNKQFSYTLPHYDKILCICGYIRMYLIFIIGLGKSPPHNRLIALVNSSRVIALRVCVFRLNNKTFCGSLLNRGYCVGIPTLHCKKNP